MKTNFLYVLIITIILSSCGTKEVEIRKHDVLDYFRKEYINIEQKKKDLDNKSITEYMEKISDEKKISQLFLISLDGNSSEQIDHIVNANKNSPGGYLLFAFNIPETAEEMITFLSDLNRAYLASENIPPFISIDHEGGVVNRLRNICSKLPSQLSIAQKFSEGEAKVLYELQGQQLKSLGIHVNIAPVVEVLTEENIEFLDDRSYGNLEDVIIYSEAQITGMKNANVLPVLKHFPGNTNNDPHTGLPILECDMNELEHTFLKPFYELVDDKVGVLVAHTVIPCVESKPACLSQKVVNLMNSGAKNFEGLVFSDDLLMKALIKNGYPIENSLIDAINAGINILMISTGSYDEYVDIVLNEYKKSNEFHSKVDESVKKILEWKISVGLLKRNVTETGYFGYEAEVVLPDAINPECQYAQEMLFNESYDVASELYDKVWWSK